MIRNYLRSLMPNVVPDYIAKKGDLAVIRERIVQSIFLFVFTLCIIALIPLEIVSLGKQDYANSFFYLGGVLLVATFTFFRRTPYLIRASLVIGALFLSSFISLNQGGYNSEIHIYLAGAAILTVLLIGNIEGIIGTLICTATLGVFAYQTTPLWVSHTIFFLAIVGIVILSAILITNSLSNTLIRQQQLTSELTDEKNSLSDRVSDATKNLELRLVQVRTASDISRAISSTLSTQELLQQVVGLVQQRFGLYYVGVFEVDETNRYAILRAGTGDAGKKMVEDGHRLPLSPTSMIGSSIISQIPRISQDVTGEAIRFRNPLLPDTQSELALPIQVRGEILGALSVQSEKSNAFTEDDLIILQGIADSLGVALENADLFEQARQDLEEIRLLNKEFVQQSWNEVLESYGELQYSHENRNVTGKAKHTLEIPLLLRDQKIGAVSLETSVEQYDQSDLELVEAIATQAALALENARLLEQTQRRAFQEQALNQLTSQFSRALTIEDILKTAVQELGKLPAVTEASIHLLTDDVKPVENADDNGHSNEEIK